MKEYEKTIQDHIELNADLQKSLRKADKKIAALEKKIGIEMKAKRKLSLTCGSMISGVYMDGELMNTFQDWEDWAYKEVSAKMVDLTDKNLFKVPEEYRYFNPDDKLFSSTKADGNNGLFRIPITFTSTPIIAQCLVSDGGGWEHVSVTINRNRCPSWNEMCKIKDVFWSNKAVVIQFHPRAPDYVNTHPNCLHLWRPCGINLDTPPVDFV